MTEVRNIYLSANFIQNSPAVKSTLESIDLHNIPWVDNTMGYPYENGGYHYVDGAFNGCTNLTTVTNINENVYDMGEAFRNCTSMVTPPIIPNNVLSLTRTFQDCASLLNTPDMKDIYGVFSLVECFINCPLIEHVSNLPHAVKQFGGAFAYCSNLKTFDTFPDDIFIEYDNGTYHLIDTDMYATFLGCSSLENSPSLPPRVSNMAYTFYNCTNLKNVPSISFRVSDMQGTFYGCSSLETAPDMNNVNGLTSMIQTFSKCSSLTSAPVIPNSVIDITETFSECSSLTSAPVIPNSVINMQGTFYGCSLLGTAPDMRNCKNVENMYLTFGFCQNLSGNVYIGSENISNVLGCFYESGTDNKNVYIPVQNNGVNTLTYQTFNSYGYSLDYRTSDGVQLFDLNAL